ncbi:glutamate--tRNA ligase [Candidatus Kuenenbacteria bacterium CG23_combo_of_CG06-09_8_20_14_all_36_9]|nr:MAG: glutamate--tRNA ligase [Candidatus Kuenenbacteria bacterium CG23_combo_of_CG06-09_8_20_14_all_36_9]
MSHKSIKTRFAPSPTGDLHIGGLRTALFAYLFAKKNNGQFFLRIEDTDQDRYKEGSVESILEGLKWAGLKYDNEIIYQSKRTEVYQKYAAELIEKGHAYYCFCTPEDLEKMRTEQSADGQTATRYDRRCLKLSKEAVAEKLKSQIPHVIRLNVGAIHELPLQQNGGIISFNDLVRGKIEFNLKDIDDQVLLKSDGFPTYHLANVVDDHEMEITHVIRAEEWLPSTPKHIILYNMFGWQIPKFAHLSMILAPDKSKLSKRHGATSVLEFKNLGYLPEAVVNYIALLGWNPGTEQEIFSLKELKQAFDLEKVNKAGAIFDIEKLNWLNGYYIRQKNLDELTELCLPYLNTENTENKKTQKTQSEYLKKVVALEQERLKKISDIGERTKYFFQRPEFDPKMLIWRKSTLADAKEKLQFLAAELEKVPDENWTRSALEQFIKGLIEAEKFDTGAVLWPMRVALSGQEKSPSPFEIAEVLGKEETVERIKLAVEK